MAYAIDSAAAVQSSALTIIPLVAWWVVVGAVAVALVACGPEGLTTARMLIPLAIPAGICALAFGSSNVIAIAAVAIGGIAVLCVFTAETGEATIQVSAYGDERRLPLRLPAAMHLPMAFAWLVWVGILTAAVLSLAGRQWLLGALLTAVVAATTAGLARRLNTFSKRWLVTVPAGIVVHDSVVLGETLMVPRRNVRQVRLALADTEAADLTGPASGHALEITGSEPMQIVLGAATAKAKASAVEATAILVAPSRPGRALRALADRALPVG